MRQLIYIKLLLLFFFCNSNILFADITPNPIEEKEQTTAKDTRTQNDTYQFSLDIRKVTNDQLTVELITPKIKNRKTIYYIPQIIPGSYSIADFGRFVSNLKAYNKKGRKLRVKRLDDNSWQIKKAHKLHKIVYTIDDTYDSPIKKKPYPMSGTNIEEEKNMVINTHGFFGYFKGMKQNDYIVNIKRPEDFYGSTGLVPDKVTSTEDTYVVEDYMRLVDAPMMYNKPDTSIIQVANTEVLVSVYSPSGAVKAAYIAENIKSLLMAQKEYLGGDLPVDKYAFIMYFAGPENTSPISGALEHSYSSFYFLPDAPQEILLPFIFDVAAHEFFHIVTPLNIHSEEIHNFDYNTPNMSKHLWMYEGITEYFAGNVQVQYDIITQDKYLEKLVSKLSNSVKNYDDDLPFTEMSEFVIEKYKEQYGNVYEKGALIGMCLDIKLRSLSDGKYGVVHLMQDLSKKYGKDKPFKDDELFDEIEKLTYPEIKTFLETYVAGSKKLPYKEIFNLVGIDYKAPEKYMGYSLGQVTLGFNTETFRLKVVSTDNADEFGKKLGLQVDDEFKKVNGQTIPIATVREFFEETKANMKEGEEFSLNILRKNDKGEQEEKELKTKIIKVPLITDPVVTWSKSINSKQEKIKNAWLKAPQAVERSNEVGQMRSKASAPKPSPKANPADVASIDAVVKALYDVISGDKETERDFERLRSLCKPNVRFDAIMTNAKGGKTHRSMSLEEYIELMTPAFKAMNFYERELGRTVNEFSNIAQVFSAFEYSNEPESDGLPVNKGMNSFQLLKDDGRWWIAHILWDGASKETPIPAKYLK